MSIYTFSVCTISYVHSVRFFVIGSFGQEKRVNVSQHNSGKFQYLWTLLSFTLRFQFMSLTVHSTYTSILFMLKDCGSPHCQQIHYQSLQCCRQDDYIEIIFLPLTEKNSHVPYLWWDKNIQLKPASCCQGCERFHLSIKSTRLILP